MSGASPRSRPSPLFAVALAAAFAACSLRMPGETDLFEQGESSGGAGVAAAGGAGSAGGEGGGDGQVSAHAGEGGVADGGSAQGGAHEGGTGGATDGGASDAGTSPGGASFGGAEGGGAGDGGAGDGGAGDGGAGDGGAGGVPRGGTSGEGGEGGASVTGGNVGTGGAGRPARLVAYFPFEDLETATEARNVVDPRNSGTYHGDCTHPAGVRRNSVSLRNRTPTTDWVELPPGLLSELSELSLSIWVRDLSTARQGGRLFDFSGGEGAQFYFAPDESSAATPSSHLSGTHGGTQFSDLWASPALTDKAWHHVAVTWNASSIELYIDGVSASRSPSAGVVPSTLGVTTENYLGRSLGDVYYGLYADLDELRLYDRALGPREILELFEDP
jgi:hypothetical protein